MAFPKGKSGNPGGRPKDSSWVKELARRRTEDAVRTLSEVMDDIGQDGRTRVMAANALLDRAWGKPTQEITGNVNVNNPDELHARIATVLAEAGSEDDAGSTGEAN